MTSNRRKNTFLSALVIVCVTLRISQVNGANILGLFTSHSPSHLIVHMSLAKVLAEEGHNVTVVASQMPKVKHDNITMIIIPPTQEQQQILDKEVSGMALKKNNILTMIRNMFGSLKLLIDLQADILRDPRFTILYDNPVTKFDLVIQGFFMNTYQLGVAAKLNAPLVVSWTAAPMLFTDIMVGNPSETSYVPDMNMAVKLGKKMNFFQRLQNFFSSIFFRIVKEFLDVHMRSFYNELFPNDGSFPSLSDMEKNVSLVFCNSHFTEGPIRPNVLAVVEIGGIQVKETPNPLPKVPKVNHKNINMIIIPPTEEQEKILSREVAGMALEKNSLINTMRNSFGSLKVMIDMQADILKDPRFTILYDNPDTRFDLVIHGFFMNTFQFGVAEKFKAPLVVSWMGAPMILSDILVGNPSEISYVPGMNMAVKQGEKMNFLQRLQNFFSSLFFKIFKILLDIRMIGFYNELFPNDGSFPSLRDMEKNVSMILCNSHFSEGPIRPNVPAVVEIGGIQVKETADPLPKDIADFLDSAKETGAILFSLGSNLQGSSIKPETATSIYNVLSKLQQKVIWKWENLGNTPGNSSNILYKKWMPQDDILAHPNIKLFITHAGKGGVAESQYHGVPMVALPVFADQHSNAMKMVAAGYGQQLELLTLTEDALRGAVVEVLNDPQYEKNVQEFSKLYRDRPLTARQSVAFWTDYVIRHHGAAHMQSPLVHMNFIEYANFDVYLFTLIVLYILYRIFKLVFLLVCSKLGKKHSTSTKNPKEGKKVKSQ